jgi:hypothetical protein
MATIASLVVDLTANTARFQRSMAQSRQTLTGFASVAQSVGKAAEDTASRINKLSSSFKDIQQKASIGFAAFVAAAGGLIKLSSDTQELDNVISQAFGHMSQEVNEWAKTTAREMGRSEYSIRQMAGTAQAMLSPMMGNIEAAAKMSKEITKLSVDMGSFWNVAEGDVFAAIRSGLVGEAEPLRRYGVDLREAALQTYALEQGIRKQVSAMSDAEKVQLRWNLIMDRTQMAQGDAARTIDQVANASRAFVGDLRGLGEDFGEYLIGPYEELLSLGRDIVGWLRDLPDETKRQIVVWAAVAGAVLGAVTALGLVVSAIGVVVKAFGIIGGLFGLLTSPFILGLIALTAAGAALYAAWNEDWFGLQTKISEWAGVVAEKFEGLKAWWETSDFGQIVRDAWAELVEVWQDDELTLPQKVLKSISITANAIADLIPAVRKIWDTWKDEDLSFGQKVLTTVSIVANSVGDLIESIMTWWTGVTLTFAKKAATLLGLDPDSLWIVQFLADLNAIWKDSDLSFGQKIVETVKLIPGGKALVSFVQSIVDIWKDDELTLPQKIVETVKVVVEGVTGLIESIMAWWTGAALTLTRKVATLLGLDPDKLWIVQFLSDLNAIWKDSDLSFGQKVVETIKLLPGGKALVGFVQSIVSIWKDGELTFPQKVVETVKIVAGGVAGLIESITTWWTGVALTLARKVATLLGIDPDSLWIVGFLADLNTIWADEDLSFGQKTVETIKLIPGGKALVGFVARVKGIWADEDLSFGQKVVETITLIPGGDSLVEFVNQIKSVWDDEELTLARKTIKTIELVVGGVTGVVEGIMAWWTNAALTLTRRGATLLGLDPDNLWLTDFLGKLNETWKNTDLSFGEKIVKSIRLIPGGDWVADFVGRLKARILGIDLQASVRKAFPDVVQLVDDQQLTDITDLVVKYAEAYGFAKDQVAALVKQESDFRDIGNSLSTAMGPLQVTQTALNDLARLGIDYDTSTLEGRVEAAVKYLQILRDHYKLTGDELIAAYYAGPTYIKQHGITDEVIFDQLSPRQYVEEFKGELARLQESAQFNGALAVPVQVVFDYTNETVQRLKDAIESGDFSAIVGVSADIWRAGANIAIGLTLAKEAVTTLIAAIQAAFGAASTGALTGAGMLAVVSVGVALTEALNDDGYGFQKFGEDLAAALAIGIGIGAFTKSPQAGVLAFTIAVNLELGSRLGDAIRNDIEEAIDEPFSVKLDRVTLDDPTGFAKWVLEGRPEDNLDPSEVYFSSGHREGTPWTGWGPLDEVAGVVHRQEAVIPWEALRKGVSGVLEFLGVPGFQGGKGAGILSTGDPALDRQLAETGDWLDSLGEGLDVMVDAIVGVFVNFFSWLGDLLIGLAKSILDEEQYAQLEALWAKGKERLQEFIDSIKSPREEVDDATQIVEDQKDQIEDVQTWWDRLFDNIKTRIDEAKTKLEEMEPIEWAEGLVDGITSAFQKSENAITRGLGNVMSHVVLAITNATQAAANILTMIGQSIGRFLANDYGKEFEKYGKRGNEAYDSFSTMVENYENWEENLAELKERQRSIDTATVGGGFLGGLLGFLIGGPFGMLIGAGVGAYAGNAAATAANAESIEELNTKLQDTLAKIKDFLGTSINGIAEAVAKAFGAENLQDFYTDLDQNLASIVRGAFVNAFVGSELMEPLLKQLSDAATEMIMTGEQLSDTTSDGATWADVIKGITSQIKGNAEGLYEIFGELGLAFEDLTETTDRATESMKNVPSTFKYNLYAHAIEVPEMASGGYVPARPGGTLVRLGEGGEGELVVPESKQGGGVHLHFHGPVYGIEGFKREVKRIMGETVRENKFATAGVIA